MSSRRRLTTGFSAVAVGSLVAVALTAGPAVAANAPPGTISGTVTAPADVPGEHQYFVEAWGQGSTEYRFSEPFGTAVLTLDSGETGAYTLNPTPDAASGEGPWRVRVMEVALAGGVPEVGDEYWKNAKRYSTATEVVIPSDRSATGIDFSPSAYAFTSTRVAGDDRYGTSVASTKGFESGVPVLYIASGEKWADALSAAPAASRQGGTLLLTDPDALPAVVAGVSTPRGSLGSELTMSRAVGTVTPC